MQIDIIQCDEHGFFDEIGMYYTVEMYNPATGRLYIAPGCGIYRKYEDAYADYDNLQ